jgi:hypothetical protein
LNDELWPILVYHLDYVPPKAIEHLGPPDVLYVSSAIGAMLIASEITGHSNHRRFPSHIEVCHAMAVGDPDLGDGPG